MQKNIIKNGFYIINKTYSGEINIKKNIYVSLFLKNIDSDLIINLEENSKVDFYGFFFDNCFNNLLIKQNNNNSILNFKSIFFDNKIDLISNIKSQISSNNSKSFLNITCIVKENKIGINSSVKIEKQSKKINSKLILENIFIGKNGVINSIPSLFIESEDVSISHSSKTHRFEENKLFYLKSRGLNEKESINIMLLSYFRKNFSCIEMFDKKIYESTFKEFLDLF